MPQSAPQAHAQTAPPRVPARAHFQTRASAASPPPCPAQMPAAPAAVPIHTPAPVLLAPAPLQSIRQRSCCQPAQSRARLPPLARQAAE
ncbi:MAG: hypothetical protein DWI64_07790 [Chloroflexi bacterium]|nr:MAG: hypothetical protein DWI64_07790 [Chloroflexota bacterium]